MQDEKVSVKKYTYISKANKLNELFPLLREDMMCFSCLYGHVKVLSLLWLLYLLSPSRARFPASLAFVSASGMGNLTDYHLTRQPDISWFTAKVVKTRCSVHRNTTSSPVLAPEGYNMYQNSNTWNGSLQLLQNYTAYGRLTPGGAWIRSWRMY